MDSSKRDYEVQKEEIAELKALNKNQFDALKLKEATHRDELEKRSRMEWRAHQEKLKELNDAQKIILIKDGELAQLNSRLLLKEDERDKLESEIKRLKSVESWQASSPEHSITRRERDMAMRNSELSYRIRTLEDNIGVLKEQKHSLQDDLIRARKDVAPLKDSNKKLKRQVNDLNTVLRLREKKVEQLSQELLNVKSAHQQLQEEYEKQRKNLAHHANQNSNYRTQNQKLKLKNEKLKESNEKWCDRAEELEQIVHECEQNISFSLPTSPIPTPRDDDSLSISSNSSLLQEQIGQLEFDRDELQSKYDEMKIEYKEVRERYKALHQWSQQVQTRHEDSILQVQRKCSFDRLALEREIMSLRSEKEENITDQKRHSYIIVAQEAKKMEEAKRIEALESFIIEQDEVMKRQERKMKYAYDELAREFDEFRSQTLIPVDSGFSLLTSDASVASLSNHELGPMEDDGDFIISRVSHAHEKSGVLDHSIDHGEYCFREDERDSIEDTVTEHSANHYEVVIQELQESAKKSITQLKKKEKEVENLKKMLSEAEGRRKELDDILKKLEEKLEDQVECNKLQLQEMNELHSKIAEDDEKIDRLNTIQSETQDEKVLLKDLLEKVQGELNAEQSEEKDSITKNLCSELADMKKESQIKDNENVQITQLQKHLSETQDEKIELNDSLQTMKEQLEHHVSESKKKERLIEDLRSELAHVEERRTGFQESRDVKVKQLQKHLSDTQNERLLLQKLNEELKNQIKESVTQLQKHLSEAQDEKIELNDSLQTMKEQLDHHESESKKKERLIEDLRSELAHVEERTEFQIKEESRDVKVKQLQKHLSEAQNERLLLQKLNEELKNQIREDNESVTQLQKHLSEAQNETLLLQKLSEELKKQKKLDQSESEKTKRVVEDLHSELVHMKRELSTVTNTGDSQDVLIKQLQKDLSDAQDEKVELKNSLESIKHHLRNQEKVSEEKSSIIDGLRSELQYMNGEMMDSKNGGKVEHLQRLLSEARDEKNESNHLLEQLKKKLKNQEELNRLQSEEKNNTIDALYSELRQMTGNVNMNEYRILGVKKDEAVKLAHDIVFTLGELEEMSSATSSKRLTDKLIEKVQHFCKLLYPKEEFGKGEKLWHHKSSEGEESIDFGMPIPKNHKSQKGDLLRVFMVVMDYDPQSLCITGHPELELYLLSGSVISVVGEMDENGYYTATYNNKKGIVPANFIQEIELLDADLISRLSYKDELKRRFQVRELHPSFDTSRNVKCCEGKLSPSNEEMKRFKPENEPLKMDTSTESYRIYIGLYDYDPLTSSSSANPEFELSFKEGSLIKIFGKEMSDGYFVGELHDQRGLVPANFIADASSIAEDRQPLLVSSKAMIALYDYRPDKDSPNLHSDIELEFNAGDHITVYGTMHSDGFYSGKLNEKFGLVPSNFIKALEQSARLSF